jgi:CBS domain containing-hemolysin-like protein
LAAPNRQAPVGRGLSIVITFAFALVLAIVFALTSARRLEAYSNETNLWRQVLQYQPDNPLAHGTLVLLAHDAGQFDRIEDQWRRVADLER